MYWVLSKKLKKRRLAGKIEYITNSEDEKDAVKQATTFEELDSAVWRAFGMTLNKAAPLAYRDEKPKFKPSIVDVETGEYTEVTRTELRTQTAKVMGQAALGPVLINGHPKLVMTTLQDYILRVQE